MIDKLKKQWWWMKFHSIWMDKSVNRMNNVEKIKMVGIVLSVKWRDTIILIIHINVKKILFFFLNQCICVAKINNRKRINGAMETWRERKTKEKPTSKQKRAICGHLMCVWKIPLRNRVAEMANTMDDTWLSINEPNVPNKRHFTVEQSPDANKQ